MTDLGAIFLHPSLSRGGISTKGAIPVSTNERKLPERTRGRLRAEFIQDSEVEKFVMLHKISWTACCFGIRTLLKQYNCYESAIIWYANHQYLAQYSDIINNLQVIPLMFCNYAVRSCRSCLVDFRFRAVGNWKEYGCSGPRHRLKYGTRA